MERNGEVFINKDDLQISMTDEEIQRSRHEFYFYPDNVVTSEGWKSYKVEDEDPFCSLPNESLTHLPTLQWESALPCSDTKNLNPITHKLIMLGDSGVGKTSLLVYYQTGKFRSGSFAATIGIALTKKSILVDGSFVHLQIWDTAGQEKFKSVTNTYYRDAHAMLLLYDVTNSNSFLNTRQWLSELREYSQENIIIMLLGNKADCDEEMRQVSLEEGERMAQEYKVGFVETSAKSGLNIDSVFELIARKLKNNNIGNDEDPKFSFTIQDVPNGNGRRSCPSCNTLLKL